MKFLSLVAISAAFFFGISGLSAQISTYFNLSDESWTALTEGLLPSPASNWTSLNGNPNGCFKGTDQAAGTWYYNSPAAYNIDLSAYYGNNLQFDLKQNTNTFQTNEPDVMIYKADGSRIVYSTSVNPGTVWTSYAVPLMETGWKYTTLAGLPVTTADMLSYLANVDRIKIRGDYSSIVTETDWLDNVIIALPILLPIELIRFESEFSKSALLLNWETLSEQDCSYFQIEKSTNNGMSFDSIGTVEAHGTTTESSIYSFTDDAFTGEAFFRLKSVDFDNSNAYSEIIYAKLPADKYLINIYPNPTSNYIMVDKTSSEQTYNSIIITDLLNKVVSITQNTANVSSTRIDLSGVYDGIYFVTIIDNHTTHTYPIEVLR